MCNLERTGQKCFWFILDVGKNGEGGGGTCSETKEYLPLPWDSWWCRKEMTGLNVDTDPHNDVHMYVLLICVKALEDSSKWSQLHLIEGAMNAVLLVRESRSNDHSSKQQEQRGKGNSVYCQCVVWTWC